jgi:hypothetical protein
VKVIGVGPTKDQSIIYKQQMRNINQLGWSRSHAVNILLKASMTITNRKEDKGSPCLTPRELLKKSDGVPLTKTEKRIDKMQCTIQEHHFSPKPHILNKYNKNFQLM